MSKSLLIYGQPVVLNRATHRHLRLKSMAQDFGFARHTNSIPVAGVEFATVAGHYPIVFAGTSKENLVAAALLGLRADENLFVGEDGGWTADYVPAFVRRYPFVLADKPDGGYHVCIDASYAGFDGDEGQPLFGADGGDEPVLQHAIAFLSEFQGHLARTRTFISNIARLDLFKPQVVRVEPPGGGAPYTLRDFYIIDEKRLLAIGEADLQSLFRSGDLAWIYAHLISLSRIPVLQRRLDRHLCASAPNVPGKRKRKRRPASAKVAP